MTVYLFILLRFDPECGGVRGGGRSETLSHIQSTPDLLQHRSLHQSHTPTSTLGEALVTSLLQPYIQHGKANLQSVSNARADVNDPTTVHDTGRKPRKKSVQRELGTCETVNSLANSLTTLACMSVHHVLCLVLACNKILETRVVRE